MSKRKGEYLIPSIIDTKKTKIEPVSVHTIETEEEYQSFCEKTWPELKTLKLHNLKLDKIVLNNCPLLQTLALFYCICESLYIDKEIRIEQLTICWCEQLKSISYNSSAARSICIEKNTHPSLLSSSCLGAPLDSLELDRVVLENNDFLTTLPMKRFTCWHVQDVQLPSLHQLYTISQFQMKDTTNLMKLEIDMNYKDIQCFLSRYTFNSKTFPKLEYLGIMDWQVYDQDDRKTKEYKEGGERKECISIQLQTLPNLESLSINANIDKLVVDEQPRLKEISLSPRDVSNLISFGALPNVETFSYENALVYPKTLILPCSCPNLTTFKLSLSRVYDDHLQDTINWRLPKFPIDAVRILHLPIFKQEDILLFQESTCPHLHELKLTFVESCTNFVWNMIFNACPQLKKMDIEGIHSTGMIQIKGEQCRSLEVLTLSCIDTPQVEIDKFQALLQLNMYIKQKISIHLKNLPLLQVFNEHHSRKGHNVELKMDETIHCHRFIQ